MIRLDERKIAGFRSRPSLHVYPTGLSDPAAHLSHLADRILGVLSGKAAPLVVLLSIYKYYKGADSSHGDYKTTRMTRTT